MTEKIKAWYFCQGKEAHGDKRPIEVGITHSYEGTPKLRQSGQHASIKALDALNYAHGFICYQVELSGEMDIGPDKISAQHRMYLKRIDCTELLPAFARWCALQVSHLIVSAEKELIIRFLESGDESIRDAARDAAWDAAENARTEKNILEVRAAQAKKTATAATKKGDEGATAENAGAAGAAGDAAWAAKAAAGTAAWDAAWAAWAARDAAWDAAWAAWDAQNAKLTEMLEEAMSNE